MKGIGGGVRRKGWERGGGALVGRDDDRGEGRRSGVGGRERRVF